MPTLRTTLFAFALGALVIGQAPAALAQIDRDSAPPPLGEVEIDFPEFQELELPNGIPMIVVEHFAQPIVNLTLYIRAGDAADPEEVAGRASLVADLLTKGTTTRTAAEIADTIEGVGGRLNAGSGDDWMSVSTSVLVEHADLAFELMRDVVMNPTFPAEELEITRRRVLSALQAQLGQPGSIAQRQFLRTVYGDHPYGISTVPETVENIGRDDLVAFHEAYFAPDNAMLVISGAMTADDAEAMAARYFGDWSGAAEPTPAFTGVPRVGETHIYLVHRPGAVQSNIRVGHPGTPPDDPDYFAVQVLNKVLGQGSDARLFRILREERGWTYGAYSRFTRPQDLGYFMANTEVRNEVTDSVVVEMLHQLRRLQTEPVPQEEFDAAINFLAGSFPLRIETPGQIASQVAQARLLGLPPEDVTEYRERIRAVTPDDVRRVARTHLHPDRVAIVVVGDANEVLEMLEPIAPVSLYDIHGDPLDRESLAVRPAEERFDASRLRERTLTYQFMVQGNPMGTITDRLERDGNQWVATSSMESPVMSQQTELRFSATDFTPVMLDQRVQQGPATITTDLRLENGRIVGHTALPEQMGGPRDIDVEAIDGILLPGMDGYVLAAADLADGRSITLPVFSTQSGDVTNVTFEVTASQEVTVPAGTFEAYRVNVAGPQPMTVYVSREAPHLVLRQEWTGQPVAMELQSID